MAKGNVRALSAGTKPTSVIDPTIVEAMREAGMDIRGTKPKELTLKMLEQAEKLVTMGCGAEAANIDTRASWNAFKRPAGRESAWQAYSSAFLCFFAAEPNDLGEVVDPGEIVALYKPVIGEVDPGLVVQGAELLRHCRHDSAGHAAMGHYRYHARKPGVLHPLDAAAYAEDRLAATPW